MDFNPMTLLPLLMGNKENGEKGNLDLQKMMGMLTSFQSGNPEALLGMLGGDNEKIKNIMSIMKTLQGKADLEKTAPLNNIKTQFNQNPTGFSNDEITRALNMLMSSKNDRK